MKKYLPLLFAALILFSVPNKVLASGPPVQANSSYTTPSAPAASNGTSTETISVHLQDSDQNDVIGHSITLSSSNDSTATFPTNGQTTDGSGNATFTVSTTTPGEVKITLFDSTSGVTFTDWLSVTFYDDTKGCVNVPAAPVLTSVVSNLDNKATLTWINSADPVSNYLVSFGIESGKYIYGDPNIGPQGTTSYTVSSLSSNKKYYFVVAATNKCGRSGFSNEISVVVGPVPSTPKPTVTPTTSPVPTASSMPSIAPSIVYVESYATPEPTEKLVATVSDSDVKTRARNIGIGIMGVGLMLIVTVLVIQYNKKEVSIPLIAENNLVDYDVPVENQDKPLINDPTQHPN